MKIENLSDEHALLLGGSTAIVAASEAAASTATHVTDTTDAHTATGISILDVGAGGVTHFPMLALTSGATNTGGFYASTNVEGALAEIGAALKVLGGSGVRYFPMLALTSAAAISATSIQGIPVSATPPLNGQWLIYNGLSGAYAAALYPNIEALGDIPLGLAEL